MFLRSEGVAAVTVAREDYPDLVAHSLNRKVLDAFLAKYPVSSLKDHTASSPQFALPELKEYIVTYQDPNKADSISRVQQELGETKQVLHKTIEQVSNSIVPVLGFTTSSMFLLEHNRRLCL